MVESVARFDADKLRADQLSVLYARGDVGDWTQQQFEGYVLNAAKTITAGTKTQFTPRGKDPANAVHADGLIWATPKARYLLEYSETKALPTRNIPYRAEFVRVGNHRPRNRKSVSSHPPPISSARVFPE